MVEIEAICCALPKNKILNNFFYNYHDRSYMKSTSKIVGVEKGFGLKTKLLYLYV